MTRYSGYGIGLLLIVGSVVVAAPNVVRLDPGTASRIAMAKDRIAKNPTQADSYILLALSLVKAARATDCPEYLNQAEQAVADSSRLATDKTGGDFEAHKALVAIRLGQARYTEALAEAKALNHKVPDDNQLYGYLADAQIALGDYAAAEKSVQWMIDQRPVNAPGLQRGAQLRDYFGYGEASLEWWNSSLRITNSSDAEERAWILVNMSRVEMRMGKAADAGKYARQALDLVADYPLACDALAAALIGQDQFNDAAEVLRRRLSAAPNVRAEFHFAEALEAAGKKEDAMAACERFATDAKAREAGPDNANRELIEYYAGHQRASDAVKLAEEEIERRRDIPTLAAYALALAAAGKYQEARVQMDRTLEPGIRDARLFLQAAVIAAKLNDKVAASRYLRKAIEINASSPEAEKAIQLLANLS